MNVRTQTAKPESRAVPSFTLAPGLLLQRKCACGAGTGASGECEECRKKKLLQRRASAPAPASVPPIVHEVLASPGRPLDTEARAFFEPRFGHDFSQVRVHTDARAAESAGAVAALAYTMGQDVVFGTGQYAPNTNAGRRLIAHELTHVIQQNRAGRPSAEVLGQPGDLFERDARRAADAIVGGHFAPVSPRGAPPALQRDEGEDKKPPTPEDLSAKALKAGPKDKKEKAAFEKTRKALEATEKKGTPGTRVEIPAEGRDAGVKGVTSSEYASEFKKCNSARSEAGLPKAFLCATNDIAFPNVAPDDAATFDTNVRVAFNKSKSGGSVWLVSASLPWMLNTAGYLDIAEIDPGMLKPYETHEKGHRAIAHRIRDRLSKFMQAELEGALPTEKKPLEKSGKNWDQGGVDAIIKQITGIRDRYMNWFDELAAAADSEWDAQEKGTLNKIAAAIKAKEPKPGSSVPKVPGE